MTDRGPLELDAESLTPVVTALRALADEYLNTPLGAPLQKKWMALATACDAVTEHVAAIRRRRLERMRSRYGHD